MHIAVVQVTKQQSDILCSKYEMNIMRFSARLYLHYGENCILSNFLLFPSRCFRCSREMQLQLNLYALLIVFFLLFPAHYESESKVPVFVQKCISLIFPLLLFCVARKINGNVA